MHVFTAIGVCVCVCVCVCVKKKILHLAPHPGPSKNSKLGTWLRLGMDKTTGCAILHQGTGGMSGAHTMVGRHKSVLLQVFGPAPGVCLALILSSSFIAAPYICPFVCMCVCIHVVKSKSYLLIVPPGNR